MAALFTKAQRKKVKIKMGVEGPSGSGKTYSALLIARGLVPGGKVAVIDTENDSASLYSHLYGYDTCSLAAPFTPEKYIEAINAAVSAGYDVLIIDSVSHEWAGKGGLLEDHGRMPGNSWTNWSKITPRHDAFVQAMLQSQIHIIATLRSKEKYAQEDGKDGKAKIRKMGAEAVQRDGLNYEFSTVLTMDISHQANSTKDRTGLFGEEWFTPGEDTGRAIAEWLESGAEVPVRQAQETAPIPQEKPRRAVIWEAYLAHHNGDTNAAKEAVLAITGGRGSKEWTDADLDALDENLGKLKE